MGGSEEITSEGVLKVLVRIWYVYAWGRGGQDVLRGGDIGGTTGPVGLVLT